MFYKDGFFNKDISDYDPVLYQSLNRELDRQQNQIELIASENIVSKSVLQAQGSVLTNKYAEGYSGKRYYNGCEHVDVAEVSSQPISHRPYKTTPTAPPAVSGDRWDGDTARTPGPYMYRPGSRLLMWLILLALTLRLIINPPVKQDRRVPIRRTLRHRQHRMRHSLIRVKDHQPISPRCHIHHHVRIANTARLLLARLEDPQTAAAPLLVPALLLQVVCHRQHRRLPTSKVVNMTLLLAARRNARHSARNVLALLALELVGQLVLTSL